MSELSFEVAGAMAEPHAAVPTILFRLRVTENSGIHVHALALRCQIRIEPQRRRYSEDEAVRLFEMFGDTPHWGDSMRPFLWTHTSMTFGSFNRSTEVDLPVECTYDFEVAGAKYLHSLSDGEIPLLFLFSGTVFTKGTTGFAAEPIAWDRESTFRLPVSVWQQVMDLYFPNSGWIRIHRDTLDRIQRFKTERALPTWDQAFEQLLKQAGEEA
ncbi:MAG: DUF6084 family protein [Acidimicrobiales bacterium]|jgi:Family of unknown function (DUF6084)